MKNLKYQLITLGLAALLASCTKVIDLKLGNNTGKLVIEANFTNIPGVQSIYLSTNVPFTSTNTYPPVTGATVLITDNKGNTFNFNESAPGTYTANLVAGISGDTYTMRVITNGKTYTATSTMPAAVELDSLTFKKDEFNPGNNYREITVHFQDPPKIANQYRFVLYDDNVQVKSIFVIDDEFTDGRNVSLDLIQNDINILPGDTVAVEMQCIDKPIYTYWFTQMQQEPNGPGGGVTPSDPPTNITPVSLGYFSAHTTQTITIVVR